MPDGVVPNGFGNSSSNQPPNRPTVGRRRRTTEANVPDGHKFCFGCSSVKPLDEYNKCSRNKTGVQVYCRSCNSIRHKELYSRRHAVYDARRIEIRKNNHDKIIAKERHARSLVPKEKAAAKRLKYTFGLTYDEYLAMLAGQGGVCAICGTFPYSKKAHLSVDHCHVSGKIRGLLCGKCNSAIGFFNDRIDLMKTAIVYIQKAKDEGTSDD